MSDVNSNASVQPDPDKARALLDSAGWKIGGSGVSTPGIVDAAALLPRGVRSKDGKALGFTLLTSNDATHRELAEAIAEQWIAIGVTVTVRPAPMLVTNFLTPRSYEAVLIDLSLAGDPDPYPFWHETQADPPGQNYSQFRDRDVSEVLEQARRTNNQAQRITLYHKFQEMFREKTPGILLYYPVYNYGISEKVRDVQIAPMAVSSDRFRTLPDWYVITRRVIQNKALFEP